ncbi:MAG: ThuA domain-containing protein [Thermoflexales bacterium]|nr:ThuA domain-containing protein [Thermoflexales bacterium]
MNGQSILLLLGGTYHDFEGFAAAAKTILEADGHTVEASYDLDALTHLDEGRYGVVLLYTCLTAVGEGDSAPPPAHSDAQVEALAAWVRAGGGLLAVHAATVASQAKPAFKALVGGVFLNHPPPFAFTAYPLSHEHPITASLEAFSVHDEFYVQAYDASVHIHMIGLDRGVAHPLVWSKSEGEGRVAYVALGHDAKVWMLEPYRRLLRQAVGWLLG